MSGFNLSSAYSDDGNFRSRQRQRVDGELVNDADRRIERIHGIDEPDTGVSITAELSDRRGGMRERANEDPISEQPDESDVRSSPPGTIGEHHDIMSENITSHFNQLGRKAKIAFTNVVDPD